MKFEEVSTAIFTLVSVKSEKEYRSTKTSAKE
jgi:hypothetical protein